MTFDLRLRVWLELLRFCRYCRFDPFDYLAWLVEHYSTKSPVGGFPMPSTRDMERLQASDGA